MIKSDIAKNELLNLAEKFISNSPNNCISKETALSPSCVALKIYEAPIFAFGSVDEELYSEYKSFDVIGSHFLSPLEWLPSAKTVISFFLPYSHAIKSANSKNASWPADEWLHGRYEGQILLKQLSDYLVQAIRETGHKALAPSSDQRFTMGNAEENKIYTSNWSERHIAYACGLGTFGLSRGIITKKGMAGRLGSILTDLDLPKDSRDYNDVYEYCSMCGLCIDRCPVKAISFEGKKNSSICSDFLDEIRDKCKPRYGCGKCQVALPCESEAPLYSF